MPTPAENLLGIDLGTSSVKALLADSNGQVIRTASAACTVSHPQAGAAEADPNDWWRAVVKAVRSLELDGAPIAGVGISTLYPALILFDNSMQPIRPAILYCDQRSAAESGGLLETFGKEHAVAVTGNAFPVGTSAITSLLWLRNHEPESIKRVHLVGMANTWLVHRLTGRHAIDFSNASLSGFYDLGENQWSDELCEIAGLTPGMLPTIMAGGDLAGHLSRDAAEQLGLTPGLPVAAGAGDTACAALGVGVRDGNDIFLNAGSTNCFGRVQQVPDFNNNLVNTCWLDPDTWLAIGATSASGAAIDWFVSTFLNGEDHDKFFELCNAVDDSGGIVFLPYLAGERTPHYDPHARALFFGMTSASTLAHHARAVAEGVCFADRQIAEQFQKTGPPVHRIIASGGGTRHPLMRSLRADVLGIPAVYSQLNDASALGAALLGGLAAGIYTGWRQASDAARHASERQTIQPDKTRHRRYDAVYQIYKELYPRLRELFALGLS